MEEIRWQDICNDSLNIDKTLSDYRNYVLIEPEDEEEALHRISCIGKHYFYRDLYIDEIIGMFNDILLQGYGGREIVGFLFHLFKKQLFNKKIDEYEALAIHNKYFAITIHNVEYPGTLKNIKYKASDFLKKIFVYKKDTDDQETWDNLIQLLTKLKFEW